MDDSGYHSANTSTETDVADVVPSRRRGPGKPKGYPRPEGSGRKPGTPNKTTKEIRDIAQKHGPKAVRELVKLMTSSENEATRLKAAQELLDRGYGRPVTPTEISGKDGGPMAVDRIERVIVDPNDPGHRETARRLAYLLPTAVQGDPDEPATDSDTADPELDAVQERIAAAEKAGNHDTLGSLRNQANAIIRRREAAARRPRDGG